MTTTHPLVKGSAMMLHLKSDAYLSPTFDATFDSFRDVMPRDFRFTIVRGGDGFVTVLTNLSSAPLARRIIASLESATN